MPLPSSIVQVSALSAGSTSVFDAPLTAGNRVEVLLCTTGPSSGSALLATLTDDSGTAYTRVLDETKLAVATGTGVLCVDGIVPANGTNSTSTVTLSSPNFNVNVWLAVEFRGSSSNALAEAVAGAGSTASSVSNVLANYNSRSLGSLIFTVLQEATGRTHTFGTTGSTVADFTELVNNSGGGWAIAVCQTDGADDPNTAVTINCGFSGSAARPVMLSIAFELAAPNATGFSVTRRQTGINKNQKGFALVAPTPDGTGFDVPTTIIANCTNGTCNFIRQSDGAQSVGSVTLASSGTAVMEVFSTQSAADIVFTWTTNNPAVTSPAATSFTVQAVESAFPSATPSGLWNATVAGSGFATPVAAASTVSHGTGFSEIVIAASGDRVYGEYITDTRRTICVPDAHGDLSGDSKHQIYLENSTPIDAFNGRLYNAATNLFGRGFEFPNVDGAYQWYDRITPFNGKETLVGGLFFNDAGGTMPKVTSSIANLAAFFAAFATDPVNKVSLNTIPVSTTITLAFTSSGDTLTIPGSWTSTMPFVIQGASRTTSVIQGTDPMWYNVIDTAISVPSVTFKNLTYIATNIGKFKASGATSLIFDSCDITETLAEFSKNFGVTQAAQWESPGGVYFIDCKVRAVSCSGVAGIRSTGDGLRNLIPDVVVGFDFFQNAYTGFVFSTYAKRFSADASMPDSALAQVTVASSAFNVGTNSNLTRIVVSDMPQYSGTEWLTYMESIVVKSGSLAGNRYPTVIGRTDVTNGVIYASGDLTAGLTAGVTLALSAVFQQRLHYLNTLVVTGATNNHDGTATVAWANSSQPEGVSPYEFMQFATTTTTTALKGQRFARNAAPSGRSVIVTGELAGSAVAGDLIWFMQEAHADGLQIGLQGGQGQNPGPIICMNYLQEGFQTGLLQPGASYTVSGLALVNMIAAGAQFQAQQQSQNAVFGNIIIVNNILQNTVTSAVDFFINDSIIQSTSAFSPSSWNDGMLFTNSHGIDGALPNGVGNTSGAITYDAHYNSTTSALQGRVWNTEVAYDIFGNAATTNGSTYARVGAVLGSPEDTTITAGTLTLLSQTTSQVNLLMGSANGYGTIYVTVQSSTSNGDAWTNEFGPTPNQDFSGIVLTISGPSLGDTWLYRERFDNSFETVYSNTLTVAGYANLPGSILKSYVAIGLNGIVRATTGAADREMQFPSLRGAGMYKVMIDNGTSSGQANVLASVAGTLTAGTPLDIDLTDMVDAGTMDPVILTGIKGILIQETSPVLGSNTLLIGDSSGTLTNAFSDFWTRATGQERVGSGGAMIRNNPLGYTVNSTHRILRLNADSGTVVFQVDIIGTA